jgi:lysophospholipase L1-like esterase
MKRLFLYLLTMFLYAGAIEPVYAQAKPFYKEIQEFKKADSSSFPPANAILLVGSSSFRKWTDVQEYFPGYKIINRGFGGSTFPDVIGYAPDVIIPYKPKQLLVYCGDNDLASSDTISPETVAGRFKALFHVIRAKLPKTNIAFVSIKPSPSRAHLATKMVDANKLIKAFLARQKNTAYIDVYNKMLLPNGKAKPEIFLSDSLHMNDKGYAIWQKAIKPYLKK